MFILNPKWLYIKLISLFGVSIINKSLGEVFSEWYSNYPTLGKLEDLVVKLPTKTWKIDFEFMEDFVSELEQAKMRELEAYLQATGIQDYTLTSEEQKVLADFESERFEWRGFSIWELFEIKTSKKRFDANKIEIQDNGYPYIVRTALNNGIRWYIVEDQEFLNEGNTISFWQDTATMFYQDKPYFTGDKIKIVTSKVSNFRKQNAQFFITVMMKAFSLFSWGRSSFNVKIIENQVISLPKKNNNPDYEMMEIFISAIQKLVVRDMVEYVERKMGTVKEFN